MEYRISQGWRVASAAFCLLLIAGGLALFLSPFYNTRMQNNPAAFIILGILLAGSGAALWAETIKAKISIDDYSITKEGAFGRTSLLLDEIAGYRTEKNQVFLIPKSGGKRISISDNLEDIKSLKTWIKEKYKDVDGMVVEEETKEILADEHFGNSKDEREAMLAKARKVSSIFSIAGIAACFCFILLPGPYEVLWLIVLLLPVISLYILWQFKGLITVNSSRKSAYPSLFIIIIFSCLFVFARALTNYDLYLYSKVWQYVVFMAVLLTTAVWLVAYTGHQKNINKKPIIFALAIAFAAYGYGAAIFYNCHFDKSDPQTFTVPLIRKYISHGKSTSWHIVLARWGRYTGSTNVTVAQSFYHSVQPGDSLNIYLMQGKLGIPWYFVDKQPTSPPPAEVTQ